MLSATDSNALTLGLLLSDFVPRVDPFTIAYRYKDVLAAQRASILRHALFRLLNRRIYYHDEVLSRILEIRSSVKRKLQVESKGEPTFLVRVDDFPRWDKSSEEFLRFHRILSENEIPYVLGVTPYPSKDPLNPKSKNYCEIGKADLDIIKQFSSPLFEVAMHGFSHQTTNAFRPTEIAGVEKAELEKKIRKGLEKLRSENLRIDVFIPPFNTFDFSSFEVLEKYFKVICGGPNSVLYVGVRISPSYINRTLYVPSYYPAYGTAAEIMAFVEKVKKIKDYAVVPLTLHWAWEAKNGFRHVEKLCQALQGHTVSWRSFETMASEVNGNGGASLKEVVE